MNKYISFIKDNKFIIIIITIFVLFKISSFNNDTKHYTQNQYNKIHIILLNILERFQRVLNKHNITYWAIAGTLLGSIRGGGIIKHDDDIDLGIHYNDYWKILNNKEIYEDLKIEKLHIYKRLNILRVVLHKSDDDYINNNIFIDVFPFDTVKDKLYYSYFNHRFLWPKEYFLIQELFPLKKGKLNHLEIMVPNHAISYLERVYGNCLDKNGPCWKEQIKYNPFFHQFDINLNLN